MKSASILKITSGFILAMLAILVFTPQGLAQGFSWRQRGYGCGGRFTCLAINPANPSEVFVGSSMAGYFKSTDGGESFRPLGAGLDGFAVAGLAVNPDNPKEILVLTDQGLDVSEDAGETVTKATAAVRYQAKFFGGGLILPHAGAWFVGTDTNGVYRLVKTHSGWEATSISGLQGQKVNSLGYFQDKLLAATNQGVFLHEGDTWRDLNHGLPPRSRYITDLVVSPGGAMYCAERKSGLYAFNPSAKRWEPHTPNPASLPAKDGHIGFKAVAVSPKDPNDVFLATYPEDWPFLLLNSKNGGQDWTVVKRFALTDSNENWANDLRAVEQIVCAPDGRAMFLIDRWTVWRSLDGGSSWLQAHKGLQNTVVNDIQVSQSHPDNIYLAMADNGLMISRDQGQTWKRKMAGVKDGGAVAVCLSKTNPDKVYLLVTPWKTEDTGDTAYFYLYKSLDSGETWLASRFKTARLDFDKTLVDGQAKSLVINPSLDDEVFVGVNGYGVFKIDTAGLRPGAGVQELSARGISTGLPIPCPLSRHGLLVQPENPKVMLAATQANGLYRTEDGGASWRLVSPPKTPVYSLAWDPADPARLYAGSGEKKILRSPDSGLTWQTVNLPGPISPGVEVSTLAVDPKNSSLIYAGATEENSQPADGLYFSQDHGASFTKVDFPSARVNINALFMPGPVPGAVLVGFNGLGLYQAQPVPQGPPKPEAKPRATPPGLISRP